MILKNERDIITEINKVNKNCYYFHGSDSYLIENYTNLLIKKIGISKEDGFNYHEYSNINSFSIIIDNIMMLPVFSKKRLIIIKNINFDLIENEDFEDFHDVFKDYPDESILIISNFSSEAEGTSRKKKKDTINLFDKFGVVFSIETRAKSGLVKWISDYAKKYNCSISTKNAEWIMDQNNNDLNNIILDLDKIISYIGTGEISSSLIKKLIPANLDTSIYELTKAINSGNYGRCIAVINSLKNQDKEPLLVFNILCSHYNDILRAKAALDENINISEIKEKFSYGNRDFVIKNALKESKKISWQFLDKTLLEIYATDLKIKDTLIDEFLILEILITKLFLFKQRETT